MSHPAETVRTVLDAVSVGAVIATFVGWLPPAAALMSIVWIGIQIFDRWKYGPKVKR